MAAINLRDFSNQYDVADGRMLAISQYSALYSLLGNAYGGDGRTTFALPDLRGRVLVGAGQGPGLPAFTVGQKGGATSVRLTIAELPPHSHDLSTATASLGTLQASTTLSGLSASVTGRLALKAATGGTLSNSPSNHALATTSGPTQIYSDAAPTVTMNAGSIDSSGLSVGSFSGNPSTTLSGAPAIGGTTGLTGAGQAVPTMPPYLAMTYYIAVNGIYPSRN